MHAAALAVTVLCSVFATTGTAAMPGGLEEIVVTAPMHKGEAETVHPVNVLAGEALRRSVAATLGETLKQQVGVSYASFGPGVGHPVIRGQGAPRVLVLQNSLPVGDAANTSADHADATEAVLAERIEVLRGPATLLYGSGAIGGVVNVIDRRVPSRVPAAAEGLLEYRRASDAGARALVGRLDAGTGSVALHFDGFRRDSGELRVPHGADGDAGAGGRIGNSDADAGSATAGLSWVSGRGFVGLAANRLESDYGIPLGAHAHEHDGHDDAAPEPESAHGMQAVRIDLEQIRYELRGELEDPLPGVELLRAHLAWSDYAHDEIEHGVLGTRFGRRARDGRFEAVHRLSERLHGAAGVQFGRSDFVAAGEEAFVPDVDSRSWGVFVVEDLHLGDVVWEFGLRLNRDEHEPRHTAGRSFTTRSASLSALWAPELRHTLKFGLSSAGRAPTFEELFSDGVHVATASHEAGDAALDEERSLNLDLGWHFHGERLDVGIELFGNRYADFIYQRDTGLVFDRASGLMQPGCAADEVDACLPVRQWSAADARFHGVEVELGYQLSEALRVGVTGDRVRGRLDGGADVPRIPAARVAVTLDWTDSRLDAGLRLTRVLRQPHTGDGGPAVDGHLLLAAYAECQLGAGDDEWTVFLRAENLLDREVRNAASLLRDIAPEAGRSVEVGVRLRF